MYRKSAREMRALILAPIGRDALLLARTLEALSIEAVITGGPLELVDKMREGAGVVVITNEAVSTNNIQELNSWLEVQPPWSDLPFLVLMPSGQPYLYHDRAQEFSLLGNFTLIERPARPETIQSAVRAALRGRAKQYEVRRQQEALLRANADLEQFAYSTSHDLKEPIRNIRIFGDLLVKRFSANLSEQAIGFLNIMQTSAARMEHLIDDLRSYAQASSITDDLPEPIAAAKALDTAMLTLAVAIKESGSKIMVGEFPASVRIRESHLSQVFQNLIGNALKYRKPGEPSEVYVDCSRAGDFWLFRVVDNGIGISPEYKETVFGIFKRLHTKDQYEGSGMGLAICQRIVERYRGRIWVDSELGRGSTFSFTLPA